LQQVTRSEGAGGDSDSRTGSRWGGQPRGAGDRSPRQGDAESRGHPQRQGPAARRKIDPAERDLLRVLIQDRSWIDRAAREVPGDWFETAPFREVYEALRRSPENVGSPVFLEELSPSAQKAYAWLDRREAKYGLPDPDRTYEGAVGSLQIRALRREWNTLVRRMRAEIPADEYDALIQKRKALKAEIAARMPEELVKRQHRGVDPDAR